MEKIYLETSDFLPSFSSLSPWESQGVLEMGKGGTSEGLWVCLSRALRDDLGLLVDNVLEGSDLPAIFCRALKFASRHEVPCSVGVFQGERSIKKKQRNLKYI